MELRKYIPEPGPQDIWGELGLPNENAKLLEQVANGLPIRILYMLVTLTGLTQASIREALRISSSTYLRRKKKGYFTREESDRLYCLIEVLFYATSLFNGDRKAAVEWMTSKIPGLDHQRPIDMLYNHANTQAVINLITRLEYGVHS